MAEGANQQVTSRRAAALDRLKKRYPDKEFTDDEAIFGQISDDYDDYDSQLSGYRDREQKLSDMFTSDPRSAHFLTNWSKGSDPVVELVRQFGTDIKEAIDDPERQEEIAAANKEFVERVAQEKSLEEEYKTNLDASLGELGRFQSENGLSDDQVDKVMEFLMGIVKDGIMGKFTVESMDMALKALNHDVDVTEASQEGEVRGKNAQIDEKLRKRQEGDGVSMLAGTNNSAGRMPARSIFDEARGAI